MDDFKTTLKDDRKVDVMRQSTSGSEALSDGGEKFTSTAFKDLNGAKAERWNTTPEANKALADATPRHPLKAGASSSIKEHKTGLKIKLRD